MTHPTATTKLRAHLRWLIRRDMPEVLGIEALCFEFPDNEEDFIRVLRTRNSIGKVAEVRDRVVAFVIYENFKTHVNVLNLAVVPRCQRHGLGTQIIDDLKSRLTPFRRKRICVTIRERNVDGQLFFKAAGFRCVQVVHDFYEHVDDDALMMEYSR